MVSRAYEILYDDSKKHLYDTHGISAFDSGHAHGPAPGSDLEEMLHQMFGVGNPAGFGGSGSRKPRKGQDEEHPYQVSLEELYKGKTAKFASKKKVICSHCKGTGGKDKANPKQCALCQGRGTTMLSHSLCIIKLTWIIGFKQGLRSVGPGIVTQETVMCSSCKGTGSIYKEKDRCKKCKGERVTEARKVLEIYIPRGSK